MAAGEERHSSDQGARGPQSCQVTGQPPSLVLQPCNSQTLEGLWFPVKGVLDLAQGLGGRRRRPLQMALGSSMLMMVSGIPTVGRKGG